MSEMTDAEHEQKVRSRKYSGPTIPETAALLRLLDAERARADAAEREASESSEACGLAMRALDTALSALHDLSGLSTDVDDFDVLYETARNRIVR